MAWLGIPTPEYTAMVQFLHQVLGLRVAFVEPTTTELALANDDRIQVFGPGDRHYQFFAAHTPGPVALFEVDDVELARRELEAAGIEVVGEVESDAAWTWLNFRAPDGRLYELASRRTR
jgi:hypothetical protein